MNVEFDNDSYKRSPAKVELDEYDERRVVKANRDGTYQILVFTGKDYRLFTRAKITAFESYDDNVADYTIRRSGAACSTMQSQERPAIGKYRKEE